MADALTLAPTPFPNRFRLPSGELVTPPEGWECLPPGDAGVTRRVKALGPSWTVIEKKGRKSFSHGVWAPAENIARARADLTAQRDDPAHQKRQASAEQRRHKAQSHYVDEFRQAVADYLRFGVAHHALQDRLAVLITDHATPVGSGTVARTTRIPLERRIEAAVIAWLRHQTTAYDSLSIARIKGERRRVRQQLAEVSRKLLDAHRRPGPHDISACPLCRAGDTGSAVQAS